MTLTPYNTSKPRPVTIAQVQSYYQATSGVTNVGGFNITRTASDIQNGYKNDQWKAQLRAGQNASTPYSRSRVSISSEPFHAGFEGWLWPAAQAPQMLGENSPYHLRVGWYGDVPGCDIPAIDPSSLSVTRAYNQAAARLSGAYDAALSGVNIGESLGELRETLGTMMRPLNGFRNLLLSTAQSFKKKAAKLRRGKRTRRSFGKVAAETYLEFQFGWNPLASDVAQAMVEVQSDRLGLKSYPIHSRGSDQDVVKSKASYQFGGLWVDVDVDITSSVEVRFKGAIRPGSFGYGTETASWGILPHQFVPTFYNLLPWTFLVDYFSNLGSWIQAISTPTPNLAYLDQTTYRCVEQHGFGRVDASRGFYSSGHPPDVVVSTTTQPGSYSVKRILINRTSVMGSWPVPSLQLELPDFGLKWLNMAALVASKRSELSTYARGVGSRTQRNS